MELLLNLLPLMVTIGIPAVFLLRRLGFSGWLAIPFAALFFIAIWVLAFVRWPIDASSPRPSRS